MKRLITRSAAAWASRTPAAQRLARGSSLVWERRSEALLSWVRAGRRDDLDGWRAALGPLFRVAALGAVAALVYGVVRAWPWLMWALTAWWCRAAWCAGKAATGPEDASAEQQTAASEDVYEATLAWIWQMVGDRQGVHLRDLLANAQQHGYFEGLEVADFRAHLEDWDITVRKRVRVRGLGVSVGIHRDDLPAPSQPLPAADAPEPPNPQLHVA
ncbi:hypothetical protein ACIGW3_26215 [Streptomyces sp. NPDC053499]|uniref:hypothetical protein n=1 Tax=Streptomyces sp. NPDC053499 TaxID=3365707 RepID=UPI0037D212D1